MFDLKMKILLVDDMPHIRKIATKSLKEIGFSEIIEAQNGNEGWEKVATERPGLVISDYEMPMANGVDLLKRIRSDQRFSSLPFILLALNTEKDKIDEAMKCSASACLLKPFGTEILRETLDCVYRNYRARQGR